MAETAAVKPKKFNPLNLVILVLVVLVVGGAVWYWHDHKIHKSPSPESATVPGDWVEYKATKYGFEFSYPKGWSDPKLTTYSQDNVQGYEIMFSSQTKTNYTVIATLESATSTNTSSILTKADIQKTLSGSKNNFIKYDGGSYATVLVDPKTKAPGQLNLFQIINLPKLDVSAVSTEIIISPSKGCPSNKLADDTDSSCITNSVYDTVAKFSKSVSAL